MRFSSLSMSSLFALALLSPVRARGDDPGQPTAAEEATPGWVPRVDAFIDAGGELGMDGWDGETLGDDSGFFLRTLGVFLDSRLSPAVSFFAGICYGDGFGVGEAYISLHELLPGLDLRLGKIRQSFGAIQRWHLPRMDQFDLPLPLGEYLGPDGLAQVGVSLDWSLPAGWSADPRIELQLTNGSDPRLFSGEHFSVPVGLLRISQAILPSSSLRLELGLSGMYGANNRRALEDESGQRVDEPWRTTTVAGVDLSLLFFVDERDYFTWRAEGIWVGKQTGPGYLAAAGGYSYVDFSHADRWVFGLRGDLAQPFAEDAEGELLWQAVAYASWMPWAWLRMRLQASHADGTRAPAEDRLILELTLCTKMPEIARARRSR
ncbi:MAG: hypothetical protein JXR96_02730 [Deltaproteobacteria bacterium]|nr:hypothetical protein [Deltaproteobacteria bacterium]